MIDGTGNLTSSSGLYVHVHEHAYSHTRVYIHRVHTVTDFVYIVWINVRPRLLQKGNVLKSGLVMNQCHAHSRGRGQLCSQVSYTRKDWGLTQSNVALLVALIRRND